MQNLSLLFIFAGEIVVDNQDGSIMTLVIVLFSLVVVIFLTALVIALIWYRKSTFKKIKMILNHINK